jgi:hypothetical protein
MRYRIEMLTHQGEVIREVEDADEIVFGDDGIQIDCGGAIFRFDSIDYGYVKVWKVPN